jgi:hypothetical protein
MYKYVYVYKLKLRAGYFPTCMASACHYIIYSGIRGHLFITATYFCHRTIYIFL